MHAEPHPIHERLLRLLYEHRFITTTQLMRLTRSEYGSRRSALRQTHRHLHTLAERQLITSLERRIGGWQGGSQVTVWTLTSRGKRTLTGERRRLFPHHLSTTFLEHQLAVTETRVILHETAEQQNIQIRVEGEPQCWRTYLDQHGAATVLKPDLAVTATSSDYVDRYFLEVDRATENPARVIRKCWQYEHYRRSGTEQQRHGVYPAVVWIVPHLERKTQLLRALDVEPKLPRHLFTEITPDELSALIRDGPPTAG